MNRVHRCARVLAPIAVVGAGVLGVGGAALAVSGGGYQPGDQGCSNASESWTTHNSADPGCHNLQLLVRDGSGHNYAEAGIYQEKDGDNPHAAGVTVSPDGSASPKGGDDGSGLTFTGDTNYQPFSSDSCALLDMILTPIYIATGGKPCSTFNPQPPTGPPSYELVLPNGTTDGYTPDVTAGNVYFGADDNLDTGEHDGPDGNNYNCPSGPDSCDPAGGTPDTSNQNGSSDGGAIQASWHPLAIQNYADYLAALAAGDPSKLAQDPIAAASVSTGACADGICAEATTTRQTLYNGGGGGGDSRDAYDYGSYQPDPYDCSGQDLKSQKSCGAGGESARRQQEAKNVYAQPGVQTYEDPDPNGSPALPPDQFYPLPGAYVGTCGVVLGGGGFTGPPDTQLTNHDGQLAVQPSGC
jgi:hypothetical protein